MRNRAVVGFMLLTHMDEGEILLKTGGCLVQCGTNLADAA